MFIDNSICCCLWYRRDFVNRPRTLNPVDECWRQSFNFINFFLINFTVGLQDRDRSSILPVSQNLSNLFLIPISVGAFWPKSLCNLCFTTVSDSNFAMSKTIWIWIWISISIERHFIWNTQNKTLINATLNYERIIETV